MDHPEPQLPLVADRARARAAGYSDAAISRRLAGDTWARLRRGWFSQASLERDSRWRAEVLATMRAHRRPLVLSHASAARAHGWPMPVGGWGPTSYTSPVPPVRRRAGSLVLVAGLEDGDIEYRGAVMVTSPARTVVDCARRLPPHDALAIADAALRSGVALTAVSAALDQAAGRPGVEGARRVLRLANGRRESPFESWSALAFDVHDLAPTLWQATVLDEEGRFLGRSDAWWKEGVIGEADGRTKYRLVALQRSGAVDADGLAAAFDEERARERGMRRTGASIVRWAPRDVLQPVLTERLARHLRREIRVAQTTGRFTGRVLELP